MTILRPDVDFPVPAMMHRKPSTRGTNEPASAKLTHKMEGDFACQTSRWNLLRPTRNQDTRGRPAYQSCHKGSGAFAHTDTYTLNDYMLARGSFYLCIGCRYFQFWRLQGPPGDYQQVLAYKAVIDCLMVVHAPLLVVDQVYHHCGLGLQSDYYWTVIFKYPRPTPLLQLALTVWRW